MFKNILDYFFSKQPNRNKFSYNEIKSLEEDWGRDTESGKPFSGASVQDFVKSHLNMPLHLAYDTNARLARFFSEEEWRDKCKELLDIGEPLTDEILAHQCFTLQTPAPYSVEVIPARDGVAVLEGTKGTYLDFSWLTTNSSGVELRERVDVIITFNNNGSAQQIRNTYAIGQTAHILIDEYLRSGVNEISIVVTGQTSGETGRTTVTYNVISMGLSSLFKVAQSQTPINGITTLSIDYTPWGGYDKVVQFYLDDAAAPFATEFHSSTVNPSQDQATNKNKVLEAELTPGKHLLQMRMVIDFNGNSFYSETLGYEFVVTGMQQEQVTLAFTVADGVILNNIDELVIRAEQYKEVEIIWGYYTSRLSGSATVEWRSKDDKGNYTVIGSRNAATMDAVNNQAPDNLKFIPDQEGEYTLEAWVGNNMLSAYKMSVAKNSMNITKQGGIVFEVSAMGRSDEEPTTTINQWLYNTYSCTFHGSHSWKGDALVLDGIGNWAEFNISPLFNNPTGNGFTLEVTFETIASVDDDAPVLEVGRENEGHIAIYGNRAELSSANGVTVKTQYNSNEKQKIAFIVNPNKASGKSKEPNLMILQTDGVRERVTTYAETDNLTSSGTLILGNKEGKCGVKIYSIRLYHKALARDEEFQNFAVDSGSQISTILEANDIIDAQTGFISMDKLTGKVNIITITGNIDTFFGNTGDAQINADFNYLAVNPYNSFSVMGARMKNPGQSTRGFGISQQRVYLDKDSCITKDYNGTIVQGGRLPIETDIDGKLMIPEKKRRLNPQFVDSTMGLAAAFYRMMNKTYPMAQITGQGYILRNEAQHYAIEQYEKAVGVPFPYKILTVANPVPCVEFWRHDDTENFSYLSQFTMAHEKKSPYSFGQHSIYDKKLADGTPDPFNFFDKNKGNRLWDNAACLQFEILQNAEELAYFKDASTWDTPIRDDRGVIIGYNNEQVFEQQYPDPDDDPDGQYGEINIAARNKLKEFYEWAASCYQVDKGGARSHVKFQAEAADHMDLPKWAAYRVLFLKNMMVDNTVRNMQLCTDDGIHWYAKYWDTDIQFGKRNDGPLVFSPGIDRQSKDPDNPLEYAFAGHESWLWNALEAWTWFTDTLTPQINQALVEAGWTRRGYIKEFTDFVSCYPERLYNESMQTKYIDQFFDGKPYLPFMTGRSIPFIRYMVAECYQKWDAEWCSGEYSALSIYARCGGAPNGTTMYFKAAKDFTFGWALTGIERIQQKGIKVRKGEPFQFVVALPSSGSKLGVNDPVVLYGPNAYEEIDLHDICLYFSSTVQFADTYDADLGTNLKVLNIGIDKEVMKTVQSVPVAWDEHGEVTEWQDLPVRNYQSDLNYTGFNTMTRLEVLNVQGMANLEKNGDKLSDISKMTALKEFYGAGSYILSFNPADNARLDIVELPDTIRSISGNGISWNTLKFFNDNIQEVSVPVTLTNITLFNANKGNGVKDFIVSWANSVKDVENKNPYQLTLTNVNWTGLTYDFLLELAEIPRAQRNITGYIEITDKLDSDKLSTLMGLYGDNIFEFGAPLRISTSQSDYLIGIGGDAYQDESGQWCILAGHKAQLSAVRFPLQDTEKKTLWGIRGVGTGDSVSYKTVVLDTVNAEIATSESILEDYDVTFVATDGSTEGYLTVKIVKRTYPTSVRLQHIDTDGAEIMPNPVDGFYYINKVGHYQFRALFTVDGMENPDFLAGGFGKFGTMMKTDGWKWSYADNTNGLAIECETLPTGRAVQGGKEYMFCINVIGLPEKDVKNILSYYARFQNYAHLTAKDLTILLYSVFRVIGPLPNTMGGNLALYRAFLANGLEGTDDNYITNEYMRGWMQEVVIDDTEYDISGEMLPVTSLDTTTMHNVSGAAKRTMITKYFEKIPKLTMDYCRYGGVVDITENKAMTDFSSECSLVSIKLGE